MTDISPTVALELQQEVSLLAESEDAHGALYDLIEKSGFFRSGS